MPQIAFLLGDVTLARHDNHERLPRAFVAAGWQTLAIPQESVRLTPGGIRLGDHAPDDFDLVWPIGMGRFHSFFDRMQLLRLLPQQPFVVPVDALVYRHAKYAWWRHMPETYASSDPAYLKARLAEGGDWVVKPAAGSYGRDVVRICDDAAGAAAIDRLAGGERGAFCLLQRYVPEVADGEKRTLVAGGRLIGTYLRRPGSDGLTNLAAGGEPHPTELSEREHALVTDVAAELIEHGIGFAAVDTVFPHLMEVNLANPGGLATLEALHGHDPAAAVVHALCEQRGFQ